MSRFHSHLSNSVKLIESYNLGIPLSQHLKLFFSQQKKFGSKDRKIISAVCYHYFRCAKLFDKQTPIDQAILFSIFLCEKKESEFLSVLSPALNRLIHLGIPEKIRHLEIDTEQFFAFDNYLSDQIDAIAYSKSFLIQPALFVRIRPKKHIAVINALDKAEIKYETIAESTLKIINGVSLDKCLRINKDVVIQDYNSQKVFDFLLESDLLKSNQSKVSIWDTCAASGGKSILLHDIFKGNIKLTVSDNRVSILKNLSSRLLEAGVNMYKKFAQDISVKSGLSPSEKFDIVVCDVPCSGSGTWSRTPEQHFSFSKKKLPVFVNQQKEIVANVIQHIANNGLLFYITCSVFKEENEDVVEFLKSNYSVEVLKMEYLKGYEQEADTMFVAVLKSPL